MDSPEAVKAFIRKTFWWETVYSFQVVKFTSFLCYCGGPVFREWLGDGIRTQLFTGRLWTQWLYYANGRTDLAFPYGLPYYLFYGILSFQPFTATLILLGLDTVLVRHLKIYSKWYHTVAYQEASTFIVFVFPFDILLLWLAELALARKNIFLVFLIPLFKLPIGAPVYVWQFLFTSPYSVGYSDNFPRYLLVVSWMAIAIVAIRRNKKLSQAPCIFPNSPVHSNC